MSILNFGVVLRGQIVAAHCAFSVARALGEALQTQTKELGCRRGCLRGALCKEAF